MYGLKRPACRIRSRFLAQLRGVAALRNDVQDVCHPGTGAERREAERRVVQGWSLFWYAGNMGLVSFTSSHTDHSTANGYQFEFYCDHCRTGHKTPFQPSSAGIAGGILRAAGGFFGGAIGRAANVGDQLKDALRGPARDSAFQKSVEEAKKFFKQCSRCSRWVCPEKCWDASKSVCSACSLQAATQPAAAQASKCPSCGAASSGKFCPECGKAVQPAVANCGKCGTKLEPGAKFCPECGEKRG